MYHNHFEEMTIADLIVARKDAHAYFNYFDTMVRMYGDCGFADARADYEEAEQALTAEIHRRCA